ncbi:MAG: DoxX family protein [Terracidiphilus sp.]
MFGFLRMRFLPQSTDAGLLALRLIACLSLFLKHGTEKLFGFSAMNAHFPGTAILGVSPLLLLATLSDGICSLLMLVGLVTRWASLVAIVNIFGAWAVVHHFAFFGHGADHGELIVVYLAAFVALLIAGPGRFSLDARLARDGRA